MSLSCGRGDLAKLSLRFGTAILLALCLCAIPPVRGAEIPDLVRIGFYENPPKLFRGADGAFAGFWPDIVDAIAAEVGFGYRYVPCQWARCLEMLEAGEIDVMPDVAHSPERNARVRFGGQPVLYSWSSILVPAGDGVADLGDLGSGAVAVVEGSIQEAALRHEIAAKGLGARVLPVATMAETLAAARDGQARAAITNRYFATREAAGAGLRALDIPFQVTALHFAFRPDIPDAFVEAIDLAVHFQQTREGSAYLAARRRWIDLDPRTLPGWVWPLLLVLGAVAAAAAASAAAFSVLARRRTRDLRRTVFDLEEALADREAAREQVLALQQSEALGRLVGGVAHDFNNLLAVIQGNLELLRAGAGGASSAQMIQDALDAAGRGGALTRQLLSFGQRAHLVPETVDPNAALEAMGALFQRTLPTRVEVRTVLEARGRTVRIDRQQLETALLNLALNASDAMQGGGTLTLRTADADLGPDDPLLETHGIGPGRYVVLTLADSGTGMSEAVREHAFEPFFTTKPVGQGSGMGLAMVFGFVKQSGGAIVLDSRPGAGTTVRIYLPAGCDEAAASEAAGQAEPGGTEHILLVEDSAEVRRTVRRLLLALGYRVSEAADGISALECAARGAPPDLLLTDIVMPGPVQGPELASLLSERRPGLPIVFISGYAPEAALERHALCPSDIVLTKPVRQQALGDAIRRALSGAGRRAERHPGQRGDV